jgi:hypothetical protein
MRATALAVAALAAIVMIGSGSAKADTEYPWCAHLFDGTGSSNCGFDSKQQCEMTVRGNGGSCDPNPLYLAPAAEPAAAVAAPVAAPPPSRQRRPAGHQVSALSAKDKMKTCQFGADDQKLVGTARKTFISRCMTNRNDPRGPSSGQAPAPQR